MEDIYLKFRNMGFSFKDIIAWQKAYEFVLLTYKTTRKFPDFEKFGLASQFQRAAVSIAANIAEGSKKLSKADKLRLLNIAQGSLEECRFYVMLAKDLQYINEDELVEVTPESIRLRKRYLTENERKRAFRAKNAAVND